MTIKPHTVKSNAKRAARKLCEQFQGIEPAEPVQANGGVQWLPAVRLTGGLLPKEIGDQIAAAAVFAEPQPETAPLPFESATGQAGAALVEQPEIAKLTMLPPVDDDAEIPAFLKARKLPEPEPATTLKTAEADGVRKVAVPMTRNPDGSHSGELPASPDAKAKTRAAVQKLPARVVSTPEEIAERRRERQQRIADDKANPQPKPERATKTRELIKMMQQDDGATAEAIREKLGWLPHTLRGFISTLKSKGVAIETVRNGKITSYKLAAVGEAGDEAAA